ncbi:MAG: hypothetical protein JXR60_11135 [Bacteroidales bacterium]|nr:hypothetical protein [Bacteroidales bacterium]
MAFKAFCSNTYILNKSIAVIEDEFGMPGAVKQNQGSWDGQLQEIKDPANNVFVNACNTGDGNDAFFVEQNPGYTINYYYHNFFTGMDFRTCYSNTSI